MDIFETVENLRSRIEEATAAPCALAIFPGPDGSCRIEVLWPEGRKGCVLGFSREFLDSYIVQDKEYLVVQSCIAYYEKVKPSEMPEVRPAMLH